MVGGADFKGFWNVRWRAIAKPRGIPIDLPKTARSERAACSVWTGARREGRYRLSQKIVQQKKLEGRMR
jgi:hypothetical protein